MRKFDDGDYVSHIKKAKKLGTGVILGQLKDGRYNVVFESDYGEVNILDCNEDELI